MSSSPSASSGRLHYIFKVTLRSWLGGYIWKEITLLERHSVKVLVDQEFRIIGIDYV